MIIKNLRLGKSLKFNYKLLLIAVVPNKRLTVLMEGVIVKVYFNTTACKKVSFHFKLL